MYAVILNVFLSFAGCVDVVFGIFDKIAPADAADIRMFTAPDGGANVTNAFVLGFAVEHIVPHNGEDHMVVIDCAAVVAAGASL